MARNETAGYIITHAMVELGLPPVSDPYSSPDPAAIQLTQLLNGVGRELIRMHPWQWLYRESVIVTAEGDSGKYDIPEDCDHIVNMTGWSRTQRVKLPGSVTPQVWQYLRGRNLVSSTIYLVYREIENQLWVYPQPPDSSVPVGLELAMEYISRGWVLKAEEVGAGEGGAKPPPGTEDLSIYTDEATQAGDIILYDPSLVRSWLKLRFKEARGADTTAVRAEALMLFNAIAGQDVSADVLNAAGMAHPFPYLDLFRNTPDSGYGF